MSYYYPLCSRDFTFENIFSTESVSPPCFYPQRDFGMDFFYLIPDVHSREFIILYNNPPKYTIPEGRGDVVKFIIEIPENLIDDDEVFVISEGIFGYTRTIYFNEKVKFLFFSERESKLCQLKSETSLPTKGLEVYKSQFKIIDEGKCFPFDDEAIQQLKLTNVRINTHILNDKRFNCYKGLIYGFTAGLLTAKSPQEIAFQRSLQQIINLYAELKNNYQNIKQGFKSTRATASLSKVMQSVAELNRIVVVSEKLYKEIVGIQQQSEVEIKKELYLALKDRFKSKEDFEVYYLCKHYDEEFLDSKDLKTLISKYVQFQNDRGILKHFAFLREAVLNISQQLNGGKKAIFSERESDLFKSAIYNIQSDFDGWLLHKSRSRSFKLSGLEYNNLSNEIRLAEDIADIPSTALKEFNTILNIIFNNPRMHRRESPTDQVLNIVKKAGIAFGVKEGGEKSSLFNYLTNQVSSYSLENVHSSVMKNFVAFVFNPESIEKLDNYLAVKQINNKWVAFSFFCAFNGFANLSKNFLKPIFDSEDTSLHRNLNDFIASQFSRQEYPANKKHSFAAVNNNYSNTENDKEAKIAHFYDTIISPKYKISFQEFKEAVISETESEMFKQFKRRKILKKEASKIYELFTDYINSNVLL